MPEPRQTSARHVRRVQQTEQPTGVESLFGGSDADGYPVQGSAPAASAEPAEVAEQAAIHLTESSAPASPSTPTPPVRVRISPSGAQPPPVPATNTGSFPRLSSPTQLAALPVAPQTAPPGVAVASASDAAAAPPPDPATFEPQPHAEAPPTVPPELAVLRASIDNFDAALIHLLAERFKCTQRVGFLKAQLGLPPSDPGREAEQIDRLRTLASEAGLDPVFAEKFLSFIVAEVIRHHEEIAAAES